MDLFGKFLVRLYEHEDNSVILRRDCGVRRAFVFAADAYQTPVGETGSLAKNGDGSWTYWERSGERKEFDTDGKLVEIMSPQGAKLTLSMTAAENFPSLDSPPML